MPPEPTFAGRVAYAAYDVAGLLVAACALPAVPFWLWQGWGPDLRQRLGHLPDGGRGLTDRPVWVHAASVGETRAAAPLVEELRRRHPALPIVVSTMTPTGRAVAAAELRPTIATLLPVDVLRSVDRAMRALRPRCLIVIETEIWPGLLRAAARAGTPIVMVSGRVSERSQRRYRWIAPLISTALSYVSGFGMQTRADADRIIALGAAPERVRVTGSLKAARLPPAGTLPPLSGLEGRRLFIAASTQPGEERFVLTACTPLLRAHPDMLLLVAPRRPERFDAVHAELLGAGLGHQRRSRLRGAIDATVQVLLLDRIGELLAFFPFAEAAFVGGTVVPQGGHNVLEPAAFGKAVAFGPHTENVADAATALYEQGGGVWVRVPEDLGELWQRYLRDPEVAREAGRAARLVAASGAGVIDRTWELLAPHLDVS